MTETSINKVAKKAIVFQALKTRGFGIAKDDVGMRFAKFSIQEEFMSGRKAEQKPKYLLVEQDNPLREELLTLLQDQQINVYSASNQAEALNLLKREKIDLMIVAALSPFEQTAQLLEHVRKSQTTKDMPMILISNYYRSPLVDQMTQHLDKTLYLVRPFPDGEFIRIIKSFN